MSSYSTALTQGRYRLRHDSVRRKLVDWLENEQNKEHENSPTMGILPLSSRAIKVSDYRLTVFVCKLVTNMYLNINKNWYSGPLMSISMCVIYVTEFTMPK